MQYPKIIRIGKPRVGDVSFLVRVKFPRGYSRDLMAEWAYKKFDTRCHHTYDCCGNTYYHAYMHKAFRDKRNEWMIPVYGVVNI